MTNKPQAEKTQDPNQAKQGNCTTKSSQLSQKPTDNKSNKPIGTQKSQPKRKRKNRTKTKVKATIQESTPEELDDAETTHFLQTMFDERPATEVSYDQMIVDIQQAMQVLPRKAAMRRSKRYQSEATQQLYIRREREMQGCPIADRRAVKLCYAKIILKATREDWKQHVCNQINKVCEAAESKNDPL